MKYISSTFNAVICPGILTTLVLQQQHVQATTEVQ